MGGSDRHDRSVAAFKSFRHICDKISSIRRDDPLALSLEQFARHCNRAYGQDNAPLMGYTGAGRTTRPLQ
jgi:hypothetical protein